MIGDTSIDAMIVVPLFETNPSPAKIEATKRRTL